MYLNVGTDTHDSSHIVLRFSWYL